MDNATLPQVTALMRYWESHPPLHIMVAGYLGIKPKNAHAAPSAQEESMVSTVSRSEFDAALRAAGIPVK